MWSIAICPSSKTFFIAKTVIWLTERCFPGNARSVCGTAFPIPPIILNAICAYGEQQKAEDRQEQFAQRVAEIILDALADIPLGAIGSKSMESEADKEAMEKNLEYAETFLENWC